MCHRPGLEAKARLQETIPELDGDDGDNGGNDPLLNELHLRKRGPVRGLFFRSALAVVRFAPPRDFRPALACSALDGMTTNTARRIEKRHEAPGACGFSQYAARPFPAGGFLLHRSRSQHSPQPKNKMDGQTPTPTPTPPPAAAIVAAGKRTEREVELEAELEAERAKHATTAQEKKAREIRLAELEDENFRLKQVGLKPAPAVSREVTPFFFSR